MEGKKVTKHLNIKLKFNQVKEAKDYFYYDSDKHS